MVTAGAAQQAAPIHRQLSVGSDAALVQVESLKERCDELSHRLDAISTRLDSEDLAKRQLQEVKQSLAQIIGTLGTRRLAGQQRRGDAPSLCMPLVLSSRYWNIALALIICATLDRTLKTNLLCCVCLRDARSLSRGSHRCDCHSRSGQWARSREAAQKKVDAKSARESRKSYGTVHWRRSSDSGSATMSRFWSDMMSAYPSES